jgi:hypothetical protein
MDIPERILKSGDKLKTHDQADDDLTTVLYNNKIALDRVSLNGWRTGQVNFAVIIDN